MMERRSCDRGTMPVTSSVITPTRIALLNSVAATDFELDIARAAENTLKSYKQFEKLFRYPALKGGQTLPQNEITYVGFLKSHGYRIGHVTIDNSDWIIDHRLALRLEKDP